MNPPSLMHLIYTSAAAPGLGDADLEDIVQVSRTNNARRSITGMLLFTKGSFFQVLEGDEGTVQEVFATIVADPRHSHATRIIQEPIAHPDFGDWTMGFSEIAPSELEKIDGLNDFFQQGASLTALQPGRAKKLLSAFVEGRWRARLEGVAK